MNEYASLQETKNELKATTTIDDAKARQFLIQVSRRIDEEMGTLRRPFFIPYTEERQFPVHSYAVDSVYNTFLFRQPLLALTGVTQNTTDVTAQVELYPAFPSPYTQLRFTSYSYSWYDACTSISTYTPPVVKITGAWGFHTDYANAWAKVDDLAANINSSVGSLTVADADGADLDGFTPRFSPGQTIRIGTELMNITAVNTTTNVLSVRRGINGTTAAAHTAGDDVEVYQVDERIRRIAARQAAMLYARMGAFQVETLDGIGTISYPQDLLAELRATLQGYQYV